MKKLILLFMLLFSTSAIFAQIDITKRTVTLDSLKARADYIHVKSPTKFYEDIILYGNINAGYLVVDSLSINGQKIRYAAGDSLPNFDWVRNEISDSLAAFTIYTFLNGIVESGGQVKLGGTITENTDIDVTTGNRIYFTGEGDKRFRRETGTAGKFAQMVMIDPAEGDVGFTMQVNDGLGGGKYIVISDINSKGIEITENIANIGMQYDDDYSTAGLALDRWVPDIAAVRSEISDSIGAIPSLNFIEGLTKTGNNIKLGGTFSNNVVIQSTPDANNEYFYVQAYDADYYETSLYLDTARALIYNGDNADEAYVEVQENRVLFGGQLNSQKAESYFDNKGFKYAADYSNRWDDDLYIPDLAAVKSLISDSVGTIVSSPWVSVPGGISYSNSVTIDDTTKLNGFIDQNNTHYLANGAEAAFFFSDDTIEVGADLTSNSYAYGERHFSRVDNTGAYDASNLNYWAYARDSKLYSDAENYYGAYYNSAAFNNSISGFMYGISNYAKYQATDGGTHTIDYYYGFNNNTRGIQGGGSQITIDEYAGIINEFFVSVGVPGGSLTSSNVYGIKSIMNGDVDITHNVDNAYGLWLGGNFNMADTTYGIYEDFAPNYFASKTTINDTLIITDDTQADTVLFFDDGDTTRLESDNPIKIGNNSLIVDVDGKTYVDYLKVNGDFRQYKNYFTTATTNDTLNYGLYDLTPDLESTSNTRSYFNYQQININENAGIKLGKRSVFGTTLNLVNTNDSVAANLGVVNNFVDNDKGFVNIMSGAIYLASTNPNGVRAKTSSQTGANFTSNARPGSTAGSLAILDNITSVNAKMTLGNYGTATIGSAYGVNATPIFNAQTGAFLDIGTYKGITLDLTSNVSSGTITLDNNYGLYLSNTSGIHGSILDYGIYENYGKNYLGSYTEIDDSLIVTDTARFSTPMYVAGKYFDGTAGQWVQNITEDSISTPNNVVIDSSLIVNVVYFNDEAYQVVEFGIDGSADTARLDFSKYNYFYISGTSNGYLGDDLHIEVLNPKFGNYTVSIKHNQNCYITVDESNTATVGGYPVIFSNGLTSIDVLFYNWVPGINRYGITTMEDVKQ